MAFRSQDMAAVFVRVCRNIQQNEGNGSTVFGKRDGEKGYDRDRSRKQAIWKKGSLKGYPQVFYLNVSAVLYLRRPEKSWLREKRLEKIRRFLRKRE